MSRLNLWLARTLSPERLRRIGTCLLLVNVLLYGAVVALGEFPFDGLGSVMLMDFMGHLTGGRLVATGHRNGLYDLASQFAVQSSITRQPRQLDFFISPPLVAYVYAPFSSLSYAAATMVWTAVSLGLLAASGVLLLRLMPSVPATSQRLLLLLWAASQPFVQLLGSGQDTALSLLVWTAGTLLALRRQDLASGWVFSLGLLKPQLFVLPPFIFLLLGRKRALLAWAVGALAQVALTLGLFGWSGIVGWLGILRSREYLDFLQGELAPRMTSILPFLRSIAPSGLGTPARLAGAAISAGIVAITLWRLRQRARASILDERGAWALACLTTLVTAPHCFYYDLTLLVLPVALLLEICVDLPMAARHALVGAYVLSWTFPLRAAFEGAGWPLSVLSSSWMPIPLLVLWRAIPSIRSPPESARLVWASDVAAT